MALTAKTSYLPRAEADTYFLGVLETDPWSGATDADKDAALIEASTNIDRLNFVGTKIEESQEHAWPRDIKDVNGAVITTVPNQILYATCEWAMALLDGFESQMEIDSLRSSAMGYSTAKMAQSTQNVGPHEAIGVPWRAWQFLAEYMRNDRALSFVRVS